MDVRGWPSVGPRLALSLGYGFSVRDVRVEVTGGLGAIVETDSQARSDETRLRAWQGGMLTLRLPFGMALQYEDGRHRVLSERYYAEGTNDLVAELDRWARMWRVGLSVPVAG